MTTNTHGGGRSLLPAVMGGEGQTATLVSSPTYCRAQPSPPVDGTAEGCAGFTSLRAPHFHRQAICRFDDFLLHAAAYTAESA